MKNALILLAGGLGKRAGFKEPKQFLKIGNTNLLEYFLSNLDEKLFDIVIIAIMSKKISADVKLIQKKYKNLNIKFAKSGKTRQISVKNSLIKLNSYKPLNVLIHDSARPLASIELIKRIIKNLNKYSSSIPYVIYHDMKKLNNKTLLKKDKIINIQTPQGFKFQKIYNAHKYSKNINESDDSSLFEKNGYKLKMIEGEISNNKITTKKDIKFFNSYRDKEFRSGIGYDIHKIDYSSKKKLVLCGIKINHPPLIGHSDADVGLHAICDSILGALCMNDIGFHFKNTDKKWKNANSKIFIDFCKKKLIQKGFKIVNIDINFICEKPNISKLSLLMKKNLSYMLNIPINIISIKATTNEKISLIGNKEGIAAESIIQIVSV